MKLILRPIALGIIVILLSTASVLAQAPAQQQQPEFVKQGQQLMREGKPEEALALYRQTLQTSPNSVPANLAAGSVLDIMGKGEEARAGPHRGSARRPSRSAKACCCGKGHPRQRHHPRASPVLPVPEGLRRVLCGRLQSGARRTESGKPERPVHPVHDWPELREIRREAKSRGVLPQSFNGCFAQSCRRIRGSIRQEEAVLAACGLHERRPNQVPRRWLDVSDTRTPAATETLIESQPPLIGMRTRNRRDL